MSNISNVWIVYPNEDEEGDLDLILGVIKDSINLSTVLHKACDIIKSQVDAEKVTMESFDVIDDKSDTYALKVDIETKYEGSYRDFFIVQKKSLS